MAGPTLPMVQKAAQEGWNRHKLEVNNAVVVAADELIRILLANPAASIDETAAVLQGVTNRYRTIVAASAVRALENSRDAYEQWGLPDPEMAGPLGFEQARATTSWAVWNAAEKRHEASIDHIDRLIGSLGRFVRNGSRETVQGSARIAGTRWARVPGGKACDFCLMLVSRGAVYRTARTAGQVKDFHDNCDCQVIESYTDADLPMIVHDLYAEWQDTVGIATHPNLSPEDQQAAWKAHIRETRPLGYSVREIAANGTAAVYPTPAEVTVGKKLVRHVTTRNPSKPTQGGHLEALVRDLKPLVQDKTVTLRSEKSFLGRTAEAWFTSDEVLADLIANPSSVSFIQPGDSRPGMYVYTARTERPSGHVNDFEVVVQYVNGKSTIISVYPTKGDDVWALMPDGSIVRRPIGRK